MADVDGAEILYFASPLRWMEAQFTEWLAEIGHPLRTILEEGLGMPIVKTEVTYAQPLRLDDVVEQRLFADEVGHSSFAVGYEVRLAPDDSPAVTVRVVHVWSRRNTSDATRFVPTPIPAWLRRALTP